MQGRIEEAVSLEAKPPTGTFQTIVAAGRGHTTAFGDPSPRCYTERRTPWGAT